MSKVKAKPEPTAMVGVRMTVSFKEWLERLARLGRHGSVANMLEIAAVKYAKELKMSESPPVRMP